MSRLEFTLLPVSKPLYPSPRVTELRPAPHVGREWLSPPVSVAPFERAVVSWNGSGRGQIALRVRLNGTRWTDFVPIVLLDGATAQSLPPSAKGASALPVRVDTDTLIMNGPNKATEFQVRVTAAQTPENLGDLRALIVTHYRLEERRYTDKPAIPDAWGRVLDISTRSQRDCEDASIRPEVCSPTSLSMLLEYHGVKRRTVDVCREVYDREAKIYGNWPNNTGAASRLLGPSAFAAVVKMQGFDEVEREIAQGRPVVLSHRWNKGDLTNAPISRSLGHLILCVGFTSTGDVVVNDPAAKASEVRRVYQRAELFRTWQERGDGIAYVVRR